MIARTSETIVAPGFEPVAQAFESILSEAPSYSAALCVYVDSVPCLDIWGGPAQSHEGVQVLFSATKGAVALCVARLVQHGLLDLDAPVASIWPEFGQAGKSEAPIRWLLSHRMGLPTVDVPLAGMADLANTPMLVHALEQQEPYWEPGTTHGYHPWTYGTLIGEVVRRVTGVSIGQFFATEIAGPLGLDFWIGLPEPVEPRVVPLRSDALSLTHESDALDAEARDPASLTSRTVSNGLQDITTGCNQREFRAAEIPGANGVASARALARMYASCLGPVDGFRLLDDAILKQFCEQESGGVDRIFMEETRYGLGFMLPFPRKPFAGPMSFGHDGAAGALAFADREHGFSFAFLPDLFPVLGGVDPHANALVAEVLKVLR
ncbi:hypothetical protein ASC61_10480 [Aeromicrobium sp. Root344]|uniref:serine hydrolase domain-containing protein n=1 Tax=Aeromicrobium sp. Root344 TaxID=1736521 RepID=UPI0006F570BF|nr:serine hydrolase domain-containing protein [Aeromicrobium sp. Root344]KQV75394.1 hypothetical protein ASC61_10480 [Aeromicrobium sp. Root344]